MLKSGQILCDRYQLVEQLGRHPGRQTWRALDLAGNSSGQGALGQAVPEPAMPEPAMPEPALPGPGLPDDALTGDIWESEERPISQATASQATVSQTETVIIKLLAFSDEIDWGQVKLFEREAAVLQTLNHPALPCYRDSFSVEDRLLWFCIVQDDIPGQSLDQRLTGGGLRPDEAQLRRWAAALLEILIYLHGQCPPILHRDIKPSNVIWGDDQQIYLIDLGAVQNYAVQATLGASFTVVGTYGYTPLEQFGGRSVPASDLYALGATLVHLLTGVAPADLPQENLRLQFEAEISPGFRRWLLHLLEPDVQRRMPSAREALAALHQLAAPHRTALQPAQTTAFPRYGAQRSAQAYEPPSPQGQPFPGANLPPPGTASDPVALSLATVEGSAAFHSPMNSPVDLPVDLPVDSPVYPPQAIAGRGLDRPQLQSPENWAPVGARLLLKRSPDLLLVEIPGEELGYVCAVLGVGFSIWSLLVSSVALPFCLLFTLLGIFLAAPRILRFERQGREIRFSLGKPLGGYLIRLGRGDRSGWVRQVFHTVQSHSGAQQPPARAHRPPSAELQRHKTGPSPISQLQSNRRSLIVQTQQRDISIPTSLSWQEGTWLVDQIYAWFDEE